MKGKVVNTSAMTGAVEVALEDGRTVTLTGLTETDEQGEYTAFMDGEQVTFVDAEDECEIL